MKYENWQIELLREVEESRIAHWMHGVRFVSRSKGKGRIVPPRTVTLVQFNGDRRAKRWRSWSGEDRQDRGRAPWDQWATEMGFPGAQEAREEFERALILHGGRI
jgi:hypothetical protein